MTLVQFHIMIYMQSLQNQKEHQGWPRDGHLMQPCDIWIVVHKLLGMF